MNKQENITSQQANEALNSINQSKSAAAESQKPPILLAIIICLSYACIVFGYGMAEHENEWALAMWVGAIFFALSTSSTTVQRRKEGSTMKITSKPTRA